MKIFTTVVFLGKKTFSKGELRLFESDHPLVALVIMVFLITFIFVKVTLNKNMNMYV